MRGGRLGSYAGLRYYQNTTDPERANAFGDMQAALTDATAPLVFFTLELNKIDDAALDATVAADARLARFRPVLDRIRKMTHPLVDLGCILPFHHHAQQGFGARGAQQHAATIAQLGNNFIVRRLDAGVTLPIETQRQMHVDEPL